MTQGNLVVSNTTASPVTTTPMAGVTPVDGTDSHAPLDDGRPSTTDTIAAVTIAVLSCVLVITLTLIVRAIHKRRRQQRGEELHRIPTVSTGIMSANIGAYGSRLSQQSSSSLSSQPQSQSQIPRSQSQSRSHPQSSGVISWEPAMPSTSTSDLDIGPSTSRGGPSLC